MLFVDHESRLSGGEQDLLDLVAALGHGHPRIKIHAALPAEGPLSRALADQGCGVHLVAFGDQMRKTSRWELQRRPHLAILRLMDAMRTARALGRLMDEIKPRVVHTNSMKSHFLALVPARFRGIPVIWHVRDILGEGWLRRVFRFVGGRGPAHILCISEATRRQFDGSRAHSRSRVVYNGIDLRRFDDVDRAGWRLRLGAPGDEVLVGIVGQISGWKGQDTFIEAAGVVSKQVPEARFVVVGECLFPENEGEYERRIHTRASELGLDPVLVWAGWSDDPQSVMSAIDVVVHASHLPEPFGRVIVEGMAAGRPVIASSEGAGPEIVRDGEGLVIPPGEPGLLVDALLPLVTSGDVRKRMGESARAGARRFDIALTADAVASVYAELLGRAP